MRWERWLGKARTEGRNWQPSIISLCTWWKTMSSPQVCVTELQSAIQRQEWMSCSRAKQNWKSQRAKLLSGSMTYVIIYFYDFILQYSWMWCHTGSHKQKWVTGHSEPQVHNIHFWLWPNLPNKLREAFHRFTLCCSLFVSCGTDFLGLASFICVMSHLQQRSAQLTEVRENHQGRTKHHTQEVINLQQTLTWSAADFESSLCVVAKLLPASEQPAPKLKLIRLSYTPAMLSLSGTLTSHPQAQLWWECSTIQRKSSLISFLNSGISLR